ncbi:hypothetical protein [Arachidicoccus sp.]|jgi:hypothetical protein|uniref:hypothetical protein n=1 Tax=Arachidicoccus sp. TaxID=1872624 RepID=UPI003D1FB339
MNKIEPANICCRCPKDDNVFVFVYLNVDDKPPDTQGRGNALIFFKILNRKAVDISFKNAKLWLLALLYTCY